MASTVPLAAMPRPDEIAPALVRGGVTGLATVVLDMALRRERPSGVMPWVEGLLTGAAAAVLELERSTPRARRRQIATPSSGARPVRTRAEEAVRLPGEQTETLRKLHLGASALSFSVVADSSLEHYRGGFYNQAMYIGPTISALMLAASARAAAAPRRPSRPRRVLYGAAVLTGLTGTGFHLYNVGKREGGWRWVNIFYGAPVAAPLGITFAGLFGLASSSLARSARRRQAPRLLGRPAGTVLGAAAAAGLLGTSAEAGMLHFRGAFQDPVMYIPVTVPPLAALALGASALRRSDTAERAARALLWTTAAAGFLGMGFHAYGIQRNMGGWRNWSQNLLQGPPLPAPPSFTGMALAGLAALELIQGDAHG